MSIFEFIVLTALLTLVTFILIVAPNIWSSLKSSLHLSQISDYSELKLFFQSQFWGYIRYCITILILFFIITSLYIILPNTKQTFAAVSPGAGIVIFLWFVTGALFSKYLSNLYYEEIFKTQNNSKDFNINGIGSKLDKCYLPNFLVQNIRKIKFNIC
jgi:uncharacterized BrkB/YihY/UPF0761 family membrane protein